MATTIENAILRVTDQSTPNINKIDAALRKLMQTAQGLGSRSIALNITAGNLSQTARDIAALQRNLSRIGQAPATNLGSIVSALNSVTSAANSATAAIRSMNSATRAANSASNLGGGISPTSRNSRNAGYFGNYPENVPGIAARYAAWKTVQAGHDLARVGGQGILEGGSERTAQIMQGLSDDQKTMIQNESKRLGAEYRNISVAGLAELGRNAIPNLKNPADAGAVMEDMARSAAALSVVYRSGEKGIEAARQAYRGADMGGRADDPARLKEWMDQITKSTVVAGRDINPMMLAQSVANLGWIKGSIGGDAIGDLAMLMDEARGRTADYLRTYSSDLMRGNLHKDNKAAMEAAGIRKEGGGATNAELLGRDPFEHVMQVIKPLIEKKGAYTTAADGSRVLNVPKAMEALQQLGFLQSSSRYALWAMEKEEEIRRGRYKRGQVNTSADFIKSLPDKDIRSGISAFEQKMKDAADSITLKFQPLISGGIGIGTGIMSGAAQNPNLTTAAAIGAAWVGHKIIDQMANNPSMGVFTAASAAHLRAAAALHAAATRLGFGAATGPLAAGAVGTAAAKARFLGFPGGAAAGGGFMKWLMYGMGALGIGQAGMDIAQGNIGSGIVNGVLAGLMFAGKGMLGQVGIAGSILSLLDGLFNGGRATQAVVDGINALFGVGKAKADEAKKARDNPIVPSSRRMDIDNDAIDMIDDQLRTEKNKGKRAELLARRARIVADYNKHVSEVQTWHKNQIPGYSIGGENGFMAARNAERSVPVGLTRAETQSAAEQQREAAAHAAVMEQEAAYLRSQDAEKRVAEYIETRKKIKAAEGATQMLEQAARDAEQMLIKPGSKPGGGGWFDWLFTPAYGADKPPGSLDGGPITSSMTGNDPAAMGDGLAAAIETAAGIAGDAISQAGLTAGASIESGGTTAASALMEGGASAGSAITAAGEAFAAMVAGLSINVAGAASTPGRAQNTGINPQAAR